MSAHDPFQRVTAIVDLGAVERNCALLAGKLSAGTELCAVVKADGYGHGMGECAEAALRGGATRLGVATATEAFELRERVGAEVPIFVMGALTGAELDVALQARAELTVWTAEFLTALAERAGRTTPWHPGHIAERYGLFTIIVLGEGVLACVVAVETAVAESVYHRTQELREVGGFETRVQMRVYLADFTNRFHDVRGPAPNGRRAALWAAVYDTDDYSRSQQLGRQLLDSGSNGIVYQSLRHPSGECIACFRPRLVRNVRAGGHYEYRWDGSPEPQVRRL